MLTDVQGRVRRLQLDNDLILAFITSPDFGVQVKVGIRRRV